MSTYAMAGEPGPGTSMPGMAADMQAAVAAARERFAAREYFHVDGLSWVHPNNMWSRRADGLYELTGSVYAFRDDQVRKCTTRDRWGGCSCPVPAAD